MNDSVDVLPKSVPIINGSAVLIKVVLMDILSTPFVSNESLFAVAADIPDPASVWGARQLPVFSGTDWAGTWRLAVAEPRLEFRASVEYAALRRC